ncbi:MAG: flagellar hook-length control protein FliK [bacterium]
MNQLVLFSFPLSEQTAVASDGLQVAKALGLNEGNAAFSDILAKALNSANPQEKTKPDSSIAPHLPDPIPLSVLFADEVAGVESQSAFDLPASALSEDSSGRLLISLKELSAILERLNQGDTGDKPGETISLEQLLPTDGESLDKASSAGESLASVPVDELIEQTVELEIGTDSNPETASDSEEIELSKQTNAAALLVSPDASIKVAALQVENLNESSSTDNQRKKTIPVIDPRQYTDITQVNSDPETQKTLSVFENNQTEPDTQLSDTAELVVDKNGDLYIAFSIPISSGAASNQLTDTESQPAQQDLADIKTSPETSIKSEGTAAHLEIISDNAFVAKVESDTQSNPLLAVSEEAFSANTDSDTESGKSVSISDSDAKDPPLKTAKEILGESSTLQVEISTQSEIAVEANDQSVADRQGTELATKTAETVALGAVKPVIEAPQQSAESVSRSEEPEEKSQSDAKKTSESSETAGLKSQISNENQDSSLDEPDNQEQKTVRLFIRKEDLPKNLQQTDRDFVLTVRSNQNTSQAGQVNLTLGKESVNLSLSAEEVKTATGDSGKDADLKPGFRVVESSLQPDNVAVHKAELDTQLLQSITTGSQRTAETQYAASQDRPAEAPEPEPTQAAPDSSAAMKTPGSSAPTVSQPAAASQTSSGQTDGPQVIEQVVRGVSSSIGQERSHITIRLNPPQLGNVNVQLIVDNGVLTARLTAEQASTRSILEQHSNVLRQSLIDQGIKVDQVTVLREPADRQQTQQDRSQQAPDRHNRDRDGHNNGNQRDGSFSGNEKQQRSRQTPDWNFDDYFA